MSSQYWTAFAHRFGAAGSNIDSLLERPEYVSHWTVKFEDWFRNCQLHMQGRSMGTFKDWIREWLAADRPYNQVVRELLTSQGDTILNPAANFWHTGSLPGTSTLLVRRWDGLSWAVLFNQRSEDKNLPDSAIDPALHRAADAVKEWPAEDLFPQYQQRPA